MYNIIDTHCHYNLDPLVQAWSSHWQKAQAHGVEQSIVVGVDIHTSQKAIEMAVAEPELFATAGLHPTQVIEHQELHDPAEQVTLLQQLKNLVQSNTAQLVAVGEIGLDYYRLNPQDVDHQAVRTTQLALFKQQLLLANSLELPVVLHLRDTKDQAYLDALEVLQSVEVPSMIIHCFSGPVEFLNRAVEMGCFFGVDGHITYPSNTELREKLLTLPKRQILLETDAPYLPPQMYRGKTCEPWMISLTAEFIATQLQLEPAECAAAALRAFPKLLQNAEKVHSSIS